MKDTLSIKQIQVDGLYATFVLLKILAKFCGSHGTQQISCVLYSLDVLKQVYQWLRKHKCDPMKTIPSVIEESVGK